MQHTTAKKRVRVALAGVLALAMLSGCATDGNEPEDTTEVTGPFDWKRYEGETIRFVAGLQPWQENVTPLIPQFEELTGIKVEIEALPEDQFRQRLQVELTAGSDDIDVYMTSIQQDGARFAQSGWYADLAPLVNNASLTSPDYDFADFSPSVLEGHTFDGVLSALPIQLEVQMLFYRKDVLEAAGYTEAPKTLTELEEIAKAVHDPDNNLYGYTVRGKRAAAVTQLTSFILNHGASYMNGQGEAAFNTPEGIAALETYGRLIREYGPSGASNNGWEELLALFQSGSIAMWPDNSGQAAAVRNPAASQVADVVGYAPMPAGPAGEAQTFFGWAAAISANSTSKGAAWLFLQWLTGPDVVGQLQAIGIPGGRQSIEFGSDVPQEFVDAFRSALSIAQPQLPQVKSVPEIRDVIGDAIVTSIDGGDVDAAAEKAASEFNRIVASE